MREFNENTKTLPEWLKVAAVQEQFQRASQYVSEGMKSEFEVFVSCGIMPRVDSPLEAIFAIWFSALEQISHGRGNIYLTVQQDVQVNGQGYRLDFTIQPTDDGFHGELEKQGLSWPLIGVEVDGHAFHEKTREQVALRNKRDRNLQTAGWKVFHYSWSEVVRDPVSCVSEVFVYGRGIHNRLSTELWKLQSPVEAEAFEALLKQSLDK